MAPLFLVVSLIFGFCTAQKCPDSECRSKWGYCGKGVAYCGDGCQGGPCNGAPKAAPIAAPIAAPKSSGNSGCDGGECKSKWGYCGKGADYCGDGCQGGPCNGAPKAAPIAAPKATSPAPKTPSPAPKTPNPAPKSESGSPQPSSNSGCGEWKTGTMTGYDNLDGGDDAHPGCINEYCGTNDGFLNAVPVVSILARDWNAYKYHNIEINRNGKIATVQVWDECVNADCPNGEKDCCTKNAKAYGGDFLLDVDRHPLKNLFGITNYENVHEKVSYRICNAVDPKPIAAKWFKNSSNREEQPGSGMPIWGWALVAVGIACVIGILIGLTIFFLKKRSASQNETV
jgi:hypothetical protein